MSYAQSQWIGISSNLVQYDRSSKDQKAVPKRLNYEDQREGQRFYRYTLKKLWCKEVPVSEIILEGKQAQLVMH